MSLKQKKYTGQEVDDIIKREIDKVSEHYQQLLQQVRLETKEKETAMYDQYNTIINGLAAQRDFIWEQYNSLVNTLGANAIAVIFDEKENING